MNTSANRSKPFHIVVVSIVLLVARSGGAQDPSRSDADKYSVVLENDRVRVLRYHDRPGDKTSMHAHPAFVLHALTGFKRRLTFPNGEVKEREFKAGEVIFMEAQSHIGENIGTTDTRVMIVELKQATAPATTAPRGPKPASNR